MNIEIVVDANIIISALIGGSSREILFDHRYRFLTTKFTLKEVEKYIPTIAEKSGTEKRFVKETLGLIPLSIKEKKFYEGSLSEAKDMIGKIDEKDVEILALAIDTNNYLWSEDKDFEESGYEKILKTKDFF
ncbi:MAG: PIN domain-containing protein [Thermoplasmatota archaeon]